MNAKERVPEQLRMLLKQQAADEQKELERVWQLTGRDAPSTTVSGNAAKEEAVRQFEKALNEQRDRPPIRRQRRTHAGWKTVLMVGLVLLAGGWFFLVPMEQNAPVGETTLVLLPDGSRVILNSGSAIRYTRAFLGSRRSVALRGEGFFEVNADPKPFIVNTQNASVQVVGTTFNVLAWPRESAHTTLAVQEGTVRFASLNAADGVTLTAGQMSRLDGVNGVPSAPVDFDSNLSTLWKNGGFASIDRPLSELIRLLEHRFGISVHLDARVSADDTLTWIQPVLKGPQEALKDVCNIAGCTYQLLKGSHQIYAP